ncbi:hypothetical protein L228DRAFT_266532 [Xylona heveae TC161]|uniref:DUF7587 domain-containing protein n=1 Tax=Xylona heveae (strain CBS 132557 / TC161) TaxID=1328760 RepID=A0A165I098_XYLHT|nr:hypothetical protein L228DRAFT_266532 [Xylona heveae TC161]KZF24174.1 hypothetical protein L228DRAFT_266532 [Xylona heveae TC161]
MSSARRGRAEVAPRPIKKALHCYKPIRLPRIAYRAYNVLSNGMNGPTGFTAGKYVDIPVRTPSKSDKRTAEFEKAVINHLRKDSTEPSPFISATHDFLRVIHIAEEKRKAGFPVSIAVIDLWEVARPWERAARSGRHVHYVKSLFDFLALEQWQKHLYYGQSEYLIWGQVRASAIIATFSMDQLFRKFATSTLSLSFMHLDILTKCKRIREFRVTCVRTASTKDHGLAIGYLINCIGVADDLVTIFVSEILRSFQFRIAEADKSFLAAIAQGVVVPGGDDASVVKRRFKFILKGLLQRCRLADNIEELFSERELEQCITEEVVNGWVV